MLPGQLGCRSPINLATFRKQVTVLRKKGGEKNRKQVTMHDSS